nr:hypothetical protein [Burkholderia alba]
MQQFDVHPDQITAWIKEKGLLRHRLAAYLAKYITKDFAEHALNQKRYWASRA